MELKRRYLGWLTPRLGILIVPYGIETGSVSYYSLAMLILIVPYGIETGQGQIQAFLWIILIVPYGIETYKWIVLQYKWVVILIVPYGIETDYKGMTKRMWNDFNCTLWNWNFVTSPYTLHPKWYFNCTLWNWNKFVRCTFNNFQNFNCTLWNWNSVC